jgi:hypothetical protein
MTKDISMNNETLSDFSDLEDLNKDELRKKAIDEFNLDEKELEAEIERDPVYSKETADAIANIEYFAEFYENILLGKKLERKNEKEERYVQKSKAMAGSRFIEQTTGIIKSFANKSMLISGKDKDVFYTQFEDAFYTISDSVLERRNNLDVTAVRSILKMVKDIFWNLGEILLKTDRNMEKYFDNMKEKSKEYDRKAGNLLSD